MILRWLTWSTHFVTIISATCYTPDGHDHNLIVGNKTGDVYKPCRSNGRVSMCCANGPAGNGDICLPSGLCYNDHTQKYTRRSCTDPAWKDKACVNLFTNSTTIRGSSNSRKSSNSTDVDITPCGDGTWCYGATEESVDCCIAGDGVWPSSDNAYSFSSHNATMLAKVAVDDGKTPTISIEDEVKADVKKDNGARWGITIGIATIIAVVVVLVAFSIRWYFSKQKARRLKDEALAQAKDQQKRRRRSSPPNIRVYSLADLKPEMGIPTPRMGTKMGLREPAPVAEMGMLTPKVALKMQLEPPASADIRYELEG